MAEKLLADILKMALRGIAEDAYQNGVRMRMSAIGVCEDEIGLEVCLDIMGHSYVLSFKPDPANGRGCVHDLYYPSGGEDDK